MFAPRVCARLASVTVLFVACSRAPNGTVSDAGVSDDAALMAVDGVAPAPGTDAQVAGDTFHALPVHVHARKVKQLLTGLPLDENELRDLTTGAKPLRALVQVWAASPAWRTKLLLFFKQAFQQTQTDAGDYDDQLGLTTGRWNPEDRRRLIQSAEESFARTALALLDEGRPFTDVLTTERFMLNPPLMSLYAYMDAMPQDDTGKLVASAAWLLRQHPEFLFVRTSNPDPVTGKPRPIPLRASIDPQSPYFMKWFDADATPRPGCEDPQIRGGALGMRFLGEYLFGGRAGCGPGASQWTARDWDDWRMVTVRAPRAAEERTVFWDLPVLRAPTTKELVVSTPRVGFMTTPAFFANWPTNVSNSYRVTTNQAMIVALGRSFDDRDTTVQLSETSVDDQHVLPGTACFACHVTLDPMRDFFRQSFSLLYGPQLAAPATIPASARFTVDGSTPVDGRGVRALARAVAGHPRFAVAWTQKLCAFANSTPCQEDDPAFVRVANAFRSSGHRFAVLVEELFSSPLVTFAQPTSGGAPNLSITRREAFCAALEQRLDLPDLCGLQGGDVAIPGLPGPARARARNLALSIPGGGYTRGDEGALLPRDPTLFFQAATENMCALLAERLVDAGPRPRFSSANTDQAVRALVGLVLGLPANDPRAPGLTTLLQEHVDEARAAGASPTEALQSAFVLACVSPLATSLGF
jgi:hypothetical protein